MWCGECGREGKEAEVCMCVCVCVEKEKEGRETTKEICPEREELHEQERGERWEGEVAQGEGRMST